MEQRKRGQKVTTEQTKTILAEIALPKNLPALQPTPLNLKERTKIWEIIGIKLNKMKGPSKTAEDWMRYFVELKSRTRKKARCLQAEYPGIKTGPNRHKQLTDVEEKLMELLGWASIKNCDDTPSDLDPNCSMDLHSSSEDLDIKDVIPEQSIEPTEHCIIEQQEYNNSHDDESTIEIKTESISDTKIDNIDVDPHKKRKNWFEYESQKKRFINTNIVSSQDESTDINEKAANTLSGSINKLADAINNLAAAIINFNK